MIEPFGFFRIESGKLRMAGQSSRAEAMRLLKDMLTDLRRRLHGEDNPKIELDAALAQG